jgi:hypothetical protein
MKTPFVASTLPDPAVLVTCSSHEARCLALLHRLDEWKPAQSILFHYDDANPKREINHASMEEALKAFGSPTVLQFTETSPVRSLHDNMEQLHDVLRSQNDASLVLDISVFTKRHLLMMLRWLDDENYWDRLTIVYSEPEDYDVSEYIPLSFGLASVQQTPGFSACPDLSRPLHLVLFLGYEGDRALAVYEHIQPMKTTLVIPYPPYKPNWHGRTERFNSELLTLIGDDTVEKVDAIDPDATKEALTRILGKSRKHGEEARIISPLGTKPQTLGIYSYLRDCMDAPAIVYAGPLRHNHDFFSHGAGQTWLLKQAGTS